MTNQSSISAARGYLRTSVIWLSIAIVVALVLLQTVNLWARRRETFKETQARASDLSHILAEHMRNTVTAVDASLKQLVLHNARVGGPTASPDSWQPVLHTAIAGMSHVGSLTVTDANGMIRHSTIPTLIGQSRREEFLFTRLAKDHNAGIIASTPFRGLKNNQIMIPLGRRLVGADGTFQGIVVATLIPEIFRDFYNSVDVGRSGEIWVMHPNGLVFFRKSAVIGPTKQSTEAPVPLRTAITQSNAGVLVAPLEQDAPTYVSGWHALDEPPIILVVSFSLSEAMSTWRRDALLSIGLTALVALALGCVSLLLVRQLNAHIATERILVQRDQELLEAQRVAGIGAVRFIPPDLAAQPSSQLCVMLGLPQDTATMTLDALLEQLIEPDRARLGEALESCLSSGDRYQLEVRTKAEDGTERILWTEGAVQKSESVGGGASILAIFHDVTEQHLAEQRSNQAERLAAIGRLTGGVAHDFNNILTAIIGYSEILLTHVEQNNPNRNYIEEIVKAGRRAAALTKQLLAFSRKQVLQPKVIDLNHIVTDIEEMLRRLIGEDIKLVAKLHPELDRVKADPGQIEQILMNLVVNARDAMPQGGKLIIETANVYLDENYARTHVEVQSGPYVMLAVSDTGHGMDKETQLHIFEPFFTTKERGKGTGLGLSTVYGIVRQSGGNIWVYSEPGKGTTFKIYLPRIEELSERVETHTPAIKSFKGEETILLAEDEEALRKLVREVLVMCGYNVLEASRANDALLLHDQHEGRIHLLITDVVMPEMSGRELAQRLADVDHEMKVLYMSGYTDDAVVHHGILDANIPFLQKPFTPAKLSHKVREVLDDH